MGFRGTSNSYYCCEFHHYRTSVPRSKSIKIKAPTFYIKQLLFQFVTIVSHQKHQHEASHFEGFGFFVFSFGNHMDLLYSLHDSGFGPIRLLIYHIERFPGQARNYYKLQRLQSLLNFKIGRLINLFSTLQGIFIFVFQIWLNDKVRNVLIKKIQRRRLKSQYGSSFRTTSTNPLTSVRSKLSATNSRTGSSDESAPGGSLNSLPSSSDLSIPMQEDTKKQDQNGPILRKKAQKKISYNIQDSSMSLNQI